MRAKIEPPREMQPPADAPIHHAAARGVARADDEIGLAGLDRGDERREHGRVVAEVGVHLDHDRGAAAERDAEAVEVRPPQALLGRPMPHPDARIRGGQLVGDPPGAVGRAVIDDEDRRGGQRLEDRGGDGADVLRLVVGRDDDPDGGGGGGHGRPV